MSNECLESGCRHQATKEWKGRKVCPDHYDFYREQEETMRMRFQGL